MPDDSLFLLWKLHQIDLGIVEIRSRAAALDPGRTLQSEIASIEAELRGSEERAKTLHAEATDLEVKTKGIDEKIARIEKDLYGGKVVNPREVENLEKEVQVLKRQRAEADERVLELWDLYPPAKAETDAVRARRDARTKDLEAHQAKVREAQARLQEAFQKRTTDRPEALARVDAALLARYDAIRQKSGGIGMTRIQKAGSCEMCGTMVPVKSVQIAKEGRVAICEGCHRILYYSEGLV